MAKINSGRAIVHSDRVTITFDDGSGYDIQINNTTQTLNISTERMGESLLIKPHASNMVFINKTKD